MDNAPQMRPRPTARGVLGALIIPGLVLGAVTTLFLANRDELPATVATHYGPGGAADRFGSATSLFWTCVGIPLGALFLTLLTVSGWSRTRGGRVAAGAVNGFVTGMASGTLGETLLTHRGVTDAATVVSGNGIVFATLFLPVALASVCAVIAGGSGLFSPRAPQGTVRWSSVVSPPGLAWKAFVPITGLGVVLGLASGMFALVAFMVLVGLMIAAMLRVTVTVDQAGLWTRMGWGRFGFNGPAVKFSELAHTHVTKVSALKDFGGWGVRMLGGGRVGVVARSGPCLELTRTDGSSLVVTVDDPQEVLELLEEPAVS